MRMNIEVTTTADSPIDAAYALLPQRAGCRTLLDLAQAAPQYPPAPEVVDRIIATARHPHGAGYTDIAGLPHVRELIAADVAAGYDCEVEAERVVVTAGCNQAFCVVVSAIAARGDEVIVTLPYYFDHDMWLRMTGVVPVYLDPAPAAVPSVANAEQLITPRTRAILVVTPGNPTGATASPRALADLARLAARHDLALILDETYRSFRDTDDPPHALMGERWAHTVVSLHSYSKELAIPGYRVGAVISSPALGREVTKLLDCVAVCAPRIGQEAVAAGLTHAQEWRQQRAREMADRRRTFRTLLAARPGGFELLSTGGFFGWLRHPFAGVPTDQVVRDLLTRFDTLVLPGTAFAPDDRGTIRVSLSNADDDALADFADRLARAGDTASYAATR